MNISSRLCFFLSLPWIAAASFAGTACTFIDSPSPERLLAAAKQGNTNAQSRLGAMYASGRELPQDDQEALHWFHKAAAKGAARAQYNLGILHAHGRGTVQDHREAAQWYRKAADQGHAGARNNLGLLYYSGQGVPRDYQQAQRLYRSAAKQGHPEALYNLGTLYEEGRGVPQDTLQAHTWFNVAAARGHNTARQKRDQLAKTMTPQQLQEAQQQAREIAATLLLRQKSLHRNMPRNILSTTPTPPPKF